MQPGYTQMTFDLGVYFLVKEPRHHAYYGKALDPICVTAIASGISTLKAYYNT